jgi:hypothetical protein
MKHGARSCAATGVEMKVAKFSLADAALERSPGRTQMYLPATSSISAMEAP